MRALYCLCLATGLLAGEPPQPGLDRAFLARIMGDAEGGTRPWRAFRAPDIGASAVVEVVGELTPAEYRAVAFQEFLVWFRLDLAKFQRAMGGTLPLAGSLAAATLPVERFGGNPVPRTVPLGRANY